MSPTKSGPLVNMAPSSLSKWRMRCDTEEAFVYAWSESEPEKCPNGDDHVIDASRTVAVASIAEDAVKIKNLPLTPYDRVLTSEETVLLSLKPGMGVSALRDIVQSDGGGTVTNAPNAPEFVLSVDGPGSRVLLRSAERCRYLPGIGAEVGIGGHLPGPLDEGQSLRFGLFDADNGFFFEIVHNDLRVVIRKDGEDLRTGRADFSIDRMDGGGPSGLFINPFKGYIWIIRFSWYGYGAIEFSVISEDASQEQHAIPLHRYYTQARPSVSVPNLPIAVELNAGPVGTPGTAYVTGRKYSVLGKFEPMTREGSMYHIAPVVPAPDTTWTPVMSFRRKRGYLSAPVVLESVAAFCESGTSVFRVVTGATLTGPTDWTVPDCYEESETALESDRASTSAEGGVTIWKGFIRSSAAMSGMAQADDIDFYLTEDDAVTVLVRATEGLGELSVSARWQEEW